MYPSNFGIPSLDINCRWYTYKNPKKRNNTQVSAFYFYMSTDKCTQKQANKYLHTENYKSYKKLKKM